MQQQLSTSHSPTNKIVRVHYPSLNRGVYLIGHGKDMVLLPQGNFAYYDFHIAQCLTSFLKHVSPLLSVT